MFHYLFSSDLVPRHCRKTVYLTVYSAGLLWLVQTVFTTVLFFVLHLVWRTFCEFLGFCLWLDLTVCVFSHHMGRTSTIYRLNIHAWSCPYEFYRSISVLKLWNYVNMLNTVIFLTGSYTIPQGEKAVPQAPEVKGPAENPLPKEQTVERTQEP